MTQLIICLLGTPRFERNGENINLDTRKASALIAYLAIAKQRKSRDTLAALLWPEFDQTHARATLRRTLSTLNKALGGSWLEISREYISLNFNAGIWVDVDEFHSHYALWCPPNRRCRFRCCVDFLLLVRKTSPRGRSGSAKGTCRCSGRFRRKFCCDQGSVSVTFGNCVAHARRIFPRKHASLEDSLWPSTSTSPRLRR